MKRALVLEGGGAKGAFAFGALEILRQEQVNIDIVCGTSVGALNAALWATDSMILGRQVWENVTYDSTFQFRIEKWLFHRLMYVVIFFHTLHDWMNGFTVSQLLESKGNTMSSWLASIFVIFGFNVPTMLLVTITYATLPAFQPFAPLVVLISLVTSLLGCLSDGSQSKAFVFSSLFVAALIGTLVLLLTGHLMTMFLIIATTICTILLYISMNAIFKVLLKPLRLFIPSGSHIMLALMSSPILAYMLTMYLSPVSSHKIVFPSLFAACYLLSHVSWWQFVACICETPAMDSAGLLKTIRTVVGLHFQIPCLVTVAVQERIFDPDSPSFAPAEENGVSKFLVKSEMRVANYVELNNLTPELRSNYLLASASVPFGIVESVQINGMKHVDGGVADNIPIQAIIGFGKEHGITVDEIIVVRLTATESLDEIHKHWQRKERVSRLRAEQTDYEEGQLFSGPITREEESYGYHNPPTNIPYAEVGKLPEIKIICPEFHLGGLREATLRFEEIFTSELLKLGRERAEDAIKRWRAEGWM